MASSVAAAARGAGLSPESIDLIGRAHALAMERRVVTLDDDHDPRFLHPGRSVLVLLGDVGALSAAVLAVAAVHESEYEALRVRPDEVAARLGEEVAATVASLPMPGEEDLAERLVLLDEGPRLAALAERLDHLRHAHLREDRDWWTRIHAEAAAVWIPVAERTHATLAKRFEHWHRAFGRRLRSGVSRSGQP
jgi:(p)ppGpp synthase/HD superfamily hydrolase